VKYAPPDKLAPTKQSQEGTLFAVIAENDQSQWSDDTGTLYHFPKRYGGLLVPGTQVIYYKGKMTDMAFSSTRLSPDPHYFGKATIGSVYPDPASRKGDLFAVIQDFEKFRKVVSNKSGEDYYEVIPSSRKSNYWRDGVRAVNHATYAAILKEAGIGQGAPGTDAPMPPKPEPDDDFESAEEGSKTLRYVATYERDPRYRRQALAIHGLRCKACDVNMGERYGLYAEGLIHVHHVVPVSTYEKPRRIDPATELVPVCPNCHAVIHRKKTATLSIGDIRALLAKS
jgi:predicted HNH restriction endonuclease